MTPPRTPAAVALSGALALLSAAGAAGGAAEAPAEGFRFLPAGLVYRPYLADPREVRFGVSVATVTTTGVPESGDSRFLLELGGRFGLFRFPGWRGRPWQLDFEAGFRGQFDIDHSLDNLGWDGIYGLLLSADLGGGWSLRTGLHHVSSHVGDELQERSGRRRIDYTREELRLGVSRELPAGWRLYLDGGWEPIQEEGEDQEPFRAQAGVELVHPLSPTARRWQWFAALDVTAFEERDWKPGLAATAGLQAPSGDRTWRLGLAWADGPVAIGELSFHDETQLVAGVWLDL